MSLGFVLGQHIDVLLTGILAEPQDVALVRIAARVAEMAGLMRAITLLQYKPLLAEAHGKGDMALLQKHASLMVKIFVFTGIPITIGLWVFAEDAMNVFGAEFVQGAWTMRIYMGGVLLMLVCGPGNAVLSLCNCEHIASRNLLKSIAIQFSLDLLLIPRFGPIGCAVANLVAMGYLAFTSRRLAIREVGVDPSIFSIFKRVKE